MPKRMCRRHANDLAGNLREHALTLDRVFPLHGPLCERNQRVSARAGQQEQIRIEAKGRLTK